MSTGPWTMDDPAAWIEEHPEAAALAAERLGIREGHLRRTSRLVTPNPGGPPGPGGLYAWSATWGGPHGMFGADGGGYVARGAVDPDEVIGQFLEGRVNLADAGPAESLHAARAVLGEVVAFHGRPDWDTEGQVEPIEVQEWFKTEPQTTTAAELIERLKLHGPTGFELVVIDRPFGPSTMSLVRWDGGHQIDFLQPEMGWRSPLTPSTGEGATRFMATGTPLRQPERVTRDLRAPDGTRVWIETTPDLLRFADDLLRWFTSDDRDQPVGSLVVWHGFWWYGLSCDGDGLRVCATDLTVPGIAKHSWDVDVALRTYEEQEKMVSFCRVAPKYVRFTHEVTVEPGALSAEDVYLTRGPATEDHSGWTIAMAPEPASPTYVVQAHEVWRGAKYLVKYLSLPTGWRARHAGNRTHQLWNPDGKLVWDVDSGDQG